ncbi:ClbS/DfsB family four-helix bundle protein [Aestuariibius sp. 2305UL40-4]|uniref:ClbS/DfsB family four-helix bundle protein n=1 Tax=Aestuariibius violaceus TaxID=3234132 RepID=UPI00345EE381
MPAITKKDLLTLSEKEYAKLSKLIAVIPEDAALVKDEDDTSIKDVIAHRAHWIDLFLGWEADGRAGKTVHFPAEGYKWNDLKRYNADLRQKQAGLDWNAAKSMLDDRYKLLMERIESLSEKALYGGPMPGAKNNWTAGRFAEASGASHFRSAGKYIRARLRAAA